MLRGRSLHLGAAMLDAALNAAPCGAADKRPSGQRELLRWLCACTRGKPQPPRQRSHFDAQLRLQQDLITMRELVRNVLDVRPHQLEKQVHLRHLFLSTRDNHIRVMDRHSQVCAPVALLETHSLHLGPIESS